MYLDLNCTSQVEILDKDQINFLLYALSRTELHIAVIYCNRNQFEKSESHCQRGLLYARLYEGDVEADKVELLCRALTVNQELRSIQGNFVDSLILAKESYNILAITYDPVHPEVQEAAFLLIDCLLKTNEIYDAERFAEATLASLKDPANGIDQQSDAVSQGYFILAKVILHQKLEGNLNKGEMLARESLRIRELLFDKDHPYVGTSCGLLGNILSEQEKFGNETKTMLERSLAIETKHYGPDGPNVANMHGNLGNYYLFLSLDQENVDRRKELLYQAKLKYKESIRLNTNMFGPSHPRTSIPLDALSKIEYLLLECE
jgi:hypothetical protein